MSRDAAKKNAATIMTRLEKRAWSLLIVLSVAVSLTAFAKVIYVQNRLSTTVRESAYARIKTVEQRCALTQLDRRSELLQDRAIARLDPASRGQFDSLLRDYGQSYRNCEIQLTMVRRIAHAAP